MKATDYWIEGPEERRVRKLLEQLCEIAEAERRAVFEEWNEREAKRLRKVIREAGYTPEA